MNAFKIVHRNETRICVDFSYNQELVSKLKQILGTRWSKTMGARHIPYAKDAYEQLKTLFPDVKNEKSIPVEKPVIKNVLIKVTISTESESSNN